MRTVRNILLAQLLAGLGLAAIVWAWVGIGPAASTLMGGLIGVVPNAFLAARLLSAKPAAGARGVLRAGWIGELGKLAITAAMFAAVFAAVRPLYPGFLFAGFIAALLALPAGLLFDKGTDAQAPDGR